MEYERKDITNEITVLTIITTPQDATHIETMFKLFSNENTATNKEHNKLMKRIKHEEKAINMENKRIFLTDSKYNFEITSDSIIMNYNNTKCIHIQKIEKYLTLF